ncbi:MAG: hypothetical protein OEV87_05905 [Phycisphaerae bacterium]|nr:hypothetical protein [Phycisphaerae bacterium]
MRRRNHKSFILSFLAMVFAGGLSLYMTGCTDNPEAKSAKEMRNQTADAVRLSAEKREYKSAQEQVMALLETNRSGGLTKDAALLASGNLAMTQGQSLQSDLGLKAFQLQQDVDTLEKALRRSERLLIEKERIEKLLKTDDDEIIQLQKLLDGQDQEEGLKKQLELASAKMEQLLSQKELIQTGQDHTQSVLDEHQSNADDLMRQAELAKGDQRLDLEKQAFAILENRKDYYIKVQAAENELSLLDSDIALAQVRVDGLTQSIQDIQGRIDSINTSQARVSLKQQMQEIERDIAGSQERLAAVAKKIKAGWAAYREMAGQICAVYDGAIAEFTKVASRDAEFTAAVQWADSAQYAALTASALVRTQKNMADRFRTLLDSTEEQFKPFVQSQLQVSNPDDAKKAFVYFDQSVEGYKKALESVSGLSRNLNQSKTDDVKCWLLKSQLLVLHSKMQLADLIEAFDLANMTETALNELIQKGEEMGVCFTQSEAMRIVDYGLGYFPLLPLDMDAFISGKKQELSEWKRLPITEQEAAVDVNIQRIDSLIAQYGQEAASQLEPLKQEMLAAKERGFKEPAPGSSNLFGEPNSL